MTPRTPGGRAMVGALVDLVVPLVSFYGLRAAGVGLYPALLAGALASAVGALLSLVHTRRVTGMTVYAVTLMVLSTGAALVTGSPRLLLAREGLVTGITGIWFLASIWARRPLSYLFSRPMLEGRFRWPEDWEGIWERSPAFRRMWRMSSLLWGIGTLLDSAARIVLAYTLRVDVVPALTSGLYVVTSVVILVVTNVYYLRAGALDPTSRIYRIEAVGAAVRPAGR